MACNLLSLCLLQQYGQILGAAGHSASRRRRPLHDCRRIREIALHRDPAQIRASISGRQARRGLMPPGKSWEQSGAGTGIVTGLFVTAIV